MQLASSEPGARVHLHQRAFKGSSPPAQRTSPRGSLHGACSQQPGPPQALALAAAAAACAAGRRRCSSTRTRLAASSPGSTWGTGPGGSSRPLRVIISGGGPGGLALACGLAGTKGLDIRVLEGRPLERPGAKNRGRSHTIGLGRRAREALIQLGGEELWQEMSAAGVLAEGFTLHLNGVPLSLPPPEGEPVVLLDRGRIVSSLQDRLLCMELATGTSVRIDYETKVKSVDVVHRTVEVQRKAGTEEEEEELIEYDLLIGSDGVRSRVREAMNSQLPPGRFESELRVMPGRWQVLHLDLPEDMNARGVHAMVSSEAPFGLFCIPDAAGPHCVIVSWSSDDSPDELLEAQTPEMLEAVLLKYFPQLGKIPREAAESFLAAKPSKAVVSRCRPLHDPDHALCVLGDAAHAVGGGSLGQGCSAALQDAAALAECLEEGARLKEALLGPNARSAPFEDWAQGREEALVSSIAAFSEQRADEGWALLDLIELQSAAEVRASALVQGPLVFGFFLEQLGRGTLKPLADIGARLLDERLRRNQQSSQEEVNQFVTHLQFKPTMKFSPGVLVFLLEQAILGIWKSALDFLTRLQPPMQTALMATDESYAQLVGRNQTWLALLRSARAAAGVTRISCVRRLRAFAALEEEECALWAQNFTVQERLQDDVLVRQSSPVSQQCFFGIRSGTCKVFRGGAEVATLEAGDCFGEASLVLGAPSPVTVKAANDVTLLVMKGEAFRSLMASAAPELRRTLEDAAEQYGASFQEVVAEQEQGRQRVRRLLENVVSAEDAPATSHRRHSAVDLDHLLGTVGIESYSNGDLVALGCQRLRVLEQGACRVVRGGRQVRSLEAGDFFGPDLAADERVVACSDDVRVCSFTNEGQTSIGFLLNSRTNG